MEDLSAIKEAITSLSEEEYVKFMKDVHLNYPKRTVEVTNKITNYWKNVQKKEVKSSSVVPISSGQQSKSASSLKPITGSSGQERKLESSVPLPWQQSAWKTGFIFRGDKVPINGNLYVDVEKVTLKKTATEKSHQQTAATVCLVNDDGKVVLWAFIRIPHSDICQYAPQITNLNERKLGIGVDLATVHLCLNICLKGNKLIGIALKNDLKSLDYSYYNTIDLHDVYHDSLNQGFALAHIAQQLLSNRSGFQIGHHSAIDDARMTLAVYKHYLDSIKLGTFTSELKKLTATRQDYKKGKSSYRAEKCRCTS